jgi:hypothetical protein
MCSEQLPHGYDSTLKAVKKKDSGHYRGKSSPVVEEYVETE